MSPEQAKGRPADKRSDVWAFGCIVFEMLAGKRAFEGDDVGDTLAAVIRGEPDWTALPADLPRPLRAFIQGCLEKDRGRRIGHISTARFALDERTNEASAGVSTASPRGPLMWRRVMPFVATALLVAAATSAVWWWQRPRVAPQPVTRFSFSLAEGQQFTEGGLSVVAISRDGSHIAYRADRRLFIRSIGEVEARPIPGSELRNEPIATGAVFSPDGRAIAFWTGAGLNSGTLKKIPLTGGAPVAIAETGFPMGLTWDASGILYGRPGGVMRVAENSGQPELLVPVKDGLPWLPQMLPGGKAVLFTLVNNTAFSGGIEAWDNSRIVVQSLQTGDRTTLPQKGRDASYIATGHVVYASSGSLFVVPFDGARHQVTGAAMQVVDGVRGPSLGATAIGTAYYSVSETGSLIYVRGVPAATVAQDLAFVDRKGTVESLRLRPAEFRYPRVDPDGTRVAVEVGDMGNANIWIYDLTGRASPRQLTLGGRNRFPVWSGDGQRVLFQSNREGDLAIFSQRSDGSSMAERLTRPDKGTAHLPRSWSNDGKSVLVNSVITPGEAGPMGASSLLVLSLPDGKVERFSDVQSARSIHASFSPDGRWVVYDLGDTLFMPSVYVQPFPPTGAKYLVGPGGAPAWSRDGRQLFIGGRQDGVLTVQTVIATQPFTLGNAEEQPRPGFIQSATDFARMYDVMPDGRIIGVVAAADTPTSRSAPEIHVVVNWTEELKRVAPAP
jgi:serine/threonine-protein kinase